MPAKLDETGLSRRAVAIDVRLWRAVSIVGVGILVAALGIWSYGANHSYGSLQVPLTSKGNDATPAVACGLGDCFTLHDIQAGSINFTWSDGSPQTVVYVWDRNGSCYTGDGTGTPGEGVSSWVSVPAVAGNCYMVTQNGSANLTVGYHVESLSAVELDGIYVAVPGGLVLLAGLGIGLWQATRPSGEPPVN